MADVTSTLPRREGQGEGLLLVVDVVEETALYWDRLGALRGFSSVGRSIGSPVAVGFVRILGPFEAGYEFTAYVLEQALAFLAAEEDVPRLLLPVVVLAP
ncbi:hypothetical protein SBI_00024 [Streptomyces bingchenggensis BCW-1]|uniref:Uncharacterized protein n=1 Tax=Streptomyces bingchenggensis (strain BCW-1) TaxID=749414 RepID=D7BSW8_STRBB|nr:MULTISPECIES: hypothetical protein [Streptomyces]ADI03145.1 hypothetical protein SBI_00024 [Streptomyces bingchenggensis BCW-1]